VGERAIQEGGESSVRRDNSQGRPLTLEEGGLNHRLPSITLKEKASQRNIISTFSPHRKTCLFSGERRVNVPRRGRKKGQANDSSILLRRWNIYPPGRGGYAVNGGGDKELLGTPPRNLVDRLLRGRGEQRCVRGKKKIRSMSAFRRGKEKIPSTKGRA